MTIPESVVEVESQAFTCCTNLKYVAAPAHIVNDPEDIFEGCPKLDDGEKGVVVSTPATRLQVLRLQYFRPSTVPELMCQEQHAFVMTVMLVGVRHNSSNNTLPSMPNEVLVLILQQLRIQELGRQAEMKAPDDDDDDDDDAADNDNDCW
jgi:hypothetical protein